MGGRAVSTLTCQANSPAPHTFHFVFGQQLLTLRSCFTCCTSFLRHTGGANRARCVRTTSCDLDIGPRDEAQVSQSCTANAFTFRVTSQLLSVNYNTLPSSFVLEFDPGASQMLGKRSNTALIIIVLSVRGGPCAPQCSCRGKGQFGAISSLLSPLQRFRGLNAGCVPSAFTP